VLLFPSTPKECFDMTASAFDLTERLQTPVILLTDLDLGMNDTMSEPLDWDDSRAYDRGKVLTAEQLEAASERFGRYLDVDDDGICYRTYPGTHPTKGSFFTRGTSRDEYAVYTEDGAAYVRNMERLLKKWETAKSYVPAPEIVNAEHGSNIGIVYFGTTRAAALEAVDRLAEQGIAIDALRVKAFPFNHEVEEFIAQHDSVFAIEQNRDGQMRSLLINECEINPAKLIAVLNYDGMPFTARDIQTKIENYLESANVTPLRRQAGLKGERN
jgi:2-oxoglutarate ferredoxin oxidoreductase subunit alpha